MAEIIKPGNPPCNQTLQLTCDACGCVFQFKHSETKTRKETHQGGYGGESYEAEVCYMNCPEKGCKNWMYTSKAKVIPA